MSKINCNSNEKKEILFFLIFDIEIDTEILKLC